MRKPDATMARRATLGNAILLGGFALLSAALLLLHADALQWRDPGAARWLDAALVLAAWLGLLGWLRYRRLPAPRKPLPVADVAAGHDPVAVVADARVDTAQVEVSVRVVYASQTGFAEQLARQTLQNLQAAGVPARLHGIDTLTLDELRHAGRVLFVVSTTGDGEPPDMALAFSRLGMKQPAQLAGLRYGLLALGDSDYEDFCGFGRQLQRWLRASAAAGAVRSGGSGQRGRGQPASLAASPGDAFRRQRPAGLASAEVPALAIGRAPLAQSRQRGRALLSS
ncbi:MAG TPA: flavodoxin domain-containing protein [Rhodanobacter sp.]